MAGTRKGAINVELKINSKNEIEALAEIGGFDDAVEFTGSVPDGFEANFKPSYYLLQDNEIVVNQDYKEPIITDPRPSEAQQQLAQVTYQQMMTTQDITTLQTQNAQMAYQLMMQGGKA